MSDEVKKKNWFARHKVISVILGLVVIGIIASAAGGSKNNQSSSSKGGNASNTSSTSCSPGPCANAGGFTVSVSGLNRNTPSNNEFSQPEQGNHFVSMQVTMKNGTKDSKSANPFDFKLRDAQGQEHDIAFATAAGCDTWQAVDLAAGATLGPKPLCFEASGDPSAKLTLLWSPGFFSSQEQIPLQ